MGDIPKDVAENVYQELGTQIERIDEVLEEFKRNGLEHTESHTKLATRRAHFASHRGYLQSNTEEELGQ